MTFTDNKLRQFKGAIRSMSHSTHMQWSIVELTALLSRLEAAEKTFSDEPPCNCSPCDFHVGVIGAWRKAAGK